METFEQYLANKENRATYDFSSTQIDLPKGLADKIIQWGRANIPDKKLFKNPEKPDSGRENRPHVTILYGIHTDKSSRVKKLFKDTRQFTIKLGKMSMFHNEKMDVLKIEVTSPELEKLNRLLKNSLYNTQTHSEYKPHVTIAYLKKGEGDKYCGDNSFSGREFDAGEITFSSWQGVKTPIKLKPVTS